MERVVMASLTSPVTVKLGSVGRCVRLVCKVLVSYQINSFSALLISSRLHFINIISLTIRCKRISLYHKTFLCVHYMLITVLKIRMNNIIINTLYLQICWLFPLPHVSWRFLHCRVGVTEPSLRTTYRRLFCQNYPWPFPAHASFPTGGLFKLMSHNRQPWLMHPRPCSHDCCDIYIYILVYCVTDKTWCKFIGI